jgi:hypothetical protein
MARVIDTGNAFYELGLDVGGAQQSNLPLILPLAT